MVSSEDKTTFCEICDFKSFSKKVLDVHIKRKHGHIRELDGNRRILQTVSFVIQNFAAKDD